MKPILSFQLSLTVSFSPAFSFGLWSQNQGPRCSYSRWPDRIDLVLMKAGLEFVFGVGMCVDLSVQRSVNAGIDFFIIFFLVKVLNLFSCLMFYNQNDVVWKSIFGRIFTRRGEFWWGEDAIVERRGINECTSPRIDSSAIALVP